MNLQIARRRVRRQSGTEMIMFGLLVLFIYLPLFMWMFVIGMNLIFSIQTNSLARDMDNMYIHGTDFPPTPLAATCRSRSPPGWV